MTVTGDYAQDYLRLLGSLPYLLYSYHALLSGSAQADIPQRPATAGTEPRAAAGTTVVGHPRHSILNNTLEIPGRASQMNNISAVFTGVGYLRQDSQLVAVGGE